MVCNMWISSSDLLAEPAIMEPQGTGIVFRRGQVSFGTGTGNLAK